MTDIRIKGRGSREALEEHLAELDKVELPDPLEDTEPDLDAAAKEIAWLRKEVADLREQVLTTHGRTRSMVRSRSHKRLGLRIAVVIASVLAFSRMA
ncbi:hypothetical protein KX729_26000 [Rhizobium sp. XQZ8]|uniref:hypothetical protein n=1 Tax=Rhizobium populisoli TaxID=2859785 RepID=UPI001CA5C444|nr:hypothetical protein [Rhizobium populisoli]MBW6424904.1 hypothetical protein [Rhizobium populisoli]